MNAPTEPMAAAPTPRGRMIFGTTVFVMGQLAPLAVPLVWPPPQRKKTIWVANRLSRPLLLLHPPLTTLQKQNAAN